LLNKTFWSAEKNRFAFALETQNQQVDEPSVLATVPMWFGLLDDEKAGAMIAELAAPEHEADWGMRIISSRAAKYSAGGYHFGSVWPLFTGWASVGEYRYHRALPGFSNLEANAQLARDGALGHVTEVLSGDYYQPLSTSSPHQIWSAAMVVSPLLRGLFDLQTDARTCRVTLAPHLPADWTWFTIDHVRVGPASLRMAYRKTASDISLTVTRSGGGDCTLEFSPAVSPRAQIIGVEMNGRRVPFQIKRSDADQHVAVQFSVPVNTGAQRFGNITIAGQAYTVTQASGLPPCTYALGPTSGTSLPATGGVGSITVRTTGGCAWSAESDSNWLGISGELSPSIRTRLLIP